jgi:hypothetical protein
LSAHIVDCHRAGHCVKTRTWRGGGARCDVLGCCMKVWGKKVDSKCFVVDVLLCLMTFWSCLVLLFCWATCEGG